MPKNISVRVNSVYPDFMTREKLEKTNFYTVPPGHGLLSVLADHLLYETTFGNNAQNEALDLSDITLLLPTKRAINAMRDVFLERSEGRACILPQMRALGEVDEAELELEVFTFSDPDAMAFPAAITPLQRHLILARHITNIYPHIFTVGDTEPLALSSSHSLRMARDLLRLLDSAQIEQIELCDLSALVADQFAENWQQTVSFLKIITQTYPEELQKMELMEPMVKRNEVMSLYGHYLREKASDRRIIAAGSTGSTPATRDLLGIISQLPNGAVILPGLDQYLDQDTWQGISEDHPQNAMRNLLEHCRIDRSDVGILTSSDEPVDQTRVELMSEVMRPADQTHKWYAALQNFEKEKVEKALQPISLITASSHREEALVIALQLRSVLETPGKTAALVTPDRALAKRVLNEMKRWGIDVNDSAGQRLSSTLKAKFVLLVTSCLKEKFSPVSLLSLLRHPDVHLGMCPKELVHATNLLEINLLRGSRPGSGLEGLKRVARNLQEDDTAQKIFSLIDTLEHAFLPLLPFSDGTSPRLDDLLISLIEVMEMLSERRGEDKQNDLWAGEDGEALALFFNDLLENPDLLPSVAVPDLKDFLETLFEERILRQNHSAHPRLYIYGLLEARLISCDLMILGGMNEGVWPQTSAVDPWLNRPMRKQIDMPAPERRIGLSAHDFVQNFCAPEVVLTRSEKVDGVPTVPSRWLLRLKAVLDTVSNENIISTGEDWLSWARRLDAAKNVRPALPPRPTPPLNTRPHSLSVTQIEVWQRDPYAIYARHILGLQKLPDIDADPSYAEKGTLIHKIMERYTLEMTDEKSPLEFLLHIGEQEFENWQDRPSVTAFWQPRFERLAAWYVSENEKLRKDVTSQYAEVRGRVIINTEHQDFTIHGVADRIDVLCDGSLRILDYKTGVLPGKKEVGVFASQMPLEAYIAKSGGFDGIGAAKVSQMIYVKLSGGQMPGEIREAAEGTFLESSEHTINTLIDTTISGLKKRIQQFNQESTPYLTRIKPRTEHIELEYDHLSRYREWAVLQSWEDRTE